MRINRAVAITGAVLLGSMLMASALVYKADANNQMRMVAATARAKEYIPYVAAVVLPIADTPIENTPTRTPTTTPTVTPTAQPTLNAADKNYTAIMSDLMVQCLVYLDDFAGLNKEAGEDFLVTRTSEWRGKAKATITNLRETCVAMYSIDYDGTTLKDLSYQSKRAASEYNEAINHWVIGVDNWDEEEIRQAHKHLNVASIYMNLAMKQVAAYTDK